ncbi:MAG TPA: hypothetical protein VIF83_04805 [Gemmatimonadaceae bacterium]|jgi:hypothetical protein
MKSTERLTLIAAVVISLAGAVAGAQSRSSKPVKVANNPAPAAAAPAPAEALVPRDTSSQGTVTREVYEYPGVGRRDPFVSLMNSEEIRPLLADLKLVAVAFDPLGRNSVAVLRDISSKEQYRVKVGQEIGRMRVAGIREKSVIFGIEEFGYSRQETLAMSDSTKVRTQ